MLRILFLLLSVGSNEYNLIILFWFFQAVFCIFFLDGDFRLNVIFITLVSQNISLKEPLHTLLEWTKSSNQRP